MKRAVRLSMTIATALLLAGSSASCTHVHAFERGKLAHRTMVGPGVSGVAEEHVYAVQEGATGGGASAESGCGCN